MHTESEGSVLKELNRIMLKYLIVATALVSCKVGVKNPAYNSDLGNIFLEDESPSRRRKASDEELLKVVKLRGCTGHLIHPDYLMSAAHCRLRVGDRFSSGSAIVNQAAPKDITIAEIVENNNALDFVIAKIEWSNGFPDDQKYTTLIATLPSDASVSKSPNKGDEVITVGYAADKSQTWGATYAEGRLKKLGATDLYYNAGIINGSSGGGVWKKSNGMLVSLTNSGPQAIGSDGWDSKSKNDESAWNRGVAMWVAYANSAKLRELFPNGKSILAPTVNEDPNTENINSSKIFLATASSALGAEIYASVNKDVVKTAICMASDIGQCDNAEGKYYSMKEERSINGRKIFTRKINPSSFKVIKVVSLNADNQIVESRELEFVGE